MYNDTQYTIECASFNRDNHFYHNTIVKYKNKYYLCTLDTDQLYLSKYETSTWNQLISTIDYTINIYTFEDEPPFEMTIENKPVHHLPPKKELEKGISFMIRAKNEERNISFVLTSLKSIMNDPNLNAELIFVNNRSSDNTFSEVKRICEQENIKNVSLYNYDVDVYRSGQEHSDYVNKLSTNPEYEARTLAAYYNWCVDKCNKYFFMKWDCDFLAISKNIREMIIEYQLHESSENLCIWNTGKTLFIDNDNSFINTNTRYNEFRVFSKKHHAKYVNIPKWEIIDAGYLRTSTRKIFTKCVFLEVKRLTLQTELRDIFRDTHDHMIKQCIQNKLYVLYENKTDFRKDIVKIPLDPLLPINQNADMFTYLRAHNAELTELQDYWLNHYIKNRKNRVTFQNKDNILIQGLWVGNKLDTIHKMCVESFIRQNHMYVLYTYEHIENLPENVVIMDANEIMPASMIFRYEDMLAGFSDLFRNYLLYLKGGWYVDLDIYCVKRYDFPQPEIHSFDYHPRHQIERIRRDKLTTEIIHNQFYVQTNPVKVVKGSRLILSAFTFILRKILFLKINDFFTNAGCITKSEFICALKQHDYYELYTQFYTLEFKEEITFDELLDYNHVVKCDLGQKSWCEIGPLLNTRLILEHNCVDKCFRPEILQGVIKYNAVEKYIDKNIQGLQLENTYSMDLFYTMWKRKDLLKYLNDGERIKNTLFEKLQQFEPLVFDKTPPNIQVQSKKNMRYPMIFARK